MHRFSESDAAAGAPIASALNGQYVAKQSRAQTILVDQDSITTFEPITGG